MSEVKWFENVFQLKNLFIPELELPKDFLLKEEVLFKQIDKKTIAFVLQTADENKKNPFLVYQKIFPYLKIASLFSITAPTISGGGGHGLRTRNDFGKELRKPLGAIVDIRYPNKAELQNDFEIFLNKTKSIYEKYDPIINEFTFMKRALSYYYDSQIDSITDDDGFVKNMMSLEAIFNESAQDISYKLRMRVSFLIGLTAFSSKEVYQNMQELYNLRNSIVHGLEIPNNTNIIRLKLFKYSREAIKIMMILCENRIASFKKEGIGSDKSKKRILAEIDESMINPEKCSLMKEEIESKINSLRLSYEEKLKDAHWIVFRDKGAIRHP